jgi:hypothetical protein
MKRLNDLTSKVIAAAGVVVVLLAVVLVVPRLLYPPLPASRFAGVAPDRRIELETDRLKLQNDARTILLLGLAGGILLVGAYLAWRQLDVTREGQTTDRYTRAIDQLGHTQLDVRLGGIYALERIARDSPADRGMIGEVLAAFVRGHAPWPPCLPGQYDATAPIDEIPELQVRAPDVQASLTVLGRGGFAHGVDPIQLLDRRRELLDLRGTDLRHADLAGARLQGADLDGAHLEKANLRGAHLERAFIPLAHLEEADLFDAHLEGAFLGRAHLEGTHLVGTHLEGAHLPSARLNGASLDGAYLEGTRLAEARLEGADLERARLEGASLEGAVADEHTVWPAGFDWRAAGVIG